MVSPLRTAAIASTPIPNIITTIIAARNLVGVSSVHPRKRKLRHGGTDEEVVLASG